jgi:hypothetical protein
MKLRLADATGRTDSSDDFTAPDLFAAPDQYLIAMGVGRNPPIGMLDEDEIAVTAKLVAGIRDNPSIYGLHRCSFRSRNIYAVVASAIAARAKGRDDMSANRPKKGTVAVR